MGSESSPLHIINPTGFEIQLLKSILSDDALLATMRVEGTIPGFEVTVSDTQLETIIMASSVIYCRTSLVHVHVPRLHPPSTAGYFSYIIIMYKTVVTCTCVSYMRITYTNLVLHINCLCILGGEFLLRVIL